MCNSLCSKTGSNWPLLPIHTWVIHQSQRCCPPATTHSCPTTNHPLVDIIHPTQPTTHHYFWLTIVPHVFLPACSPSCHPSNPDPAPDLLLIPWSLLSLPMTHDSYYGLLPMASTCILCFLMYVSLSTCYWTHPYSVDLPHIVPSTNATSTSSPLPLHYAIHTQHSTPPPPAVW